MDMKMDLVDQMYILKPKGLQTPTASLYRLVKNGETVTSHFSSNDNFAHGDLFSHKETREAIGDMSLADFRKLQIKSDVFYENNSNI